MQHLFDLPKIKVWRAHRHVAHVDQAQAVALHHDVAWMQIPVDQRAGPLGAHQSLLQKPALTIIEEFTRIHISARERDSIGEVVGVTRNRMDLLAKAHVHRHHIIQALEIFLHVKRQCVRLQHLVHHARASAALHHVEGDSGWNASYKRLCSKCFFSFGAPLVDEVEVQLHDGLFIHFIALAVCTLGDHLQSLHRQLPVLALEMQDALEASHLQNLCDRLTHVLQQQGSLSRLHLLMCKQQHAQPN